MEVTDRLQRWRSQGIDFITDFDELKQQVEGGYSPRHHFLVLDNRNSQMEQYWNWIANQINALPYRIVVVGAHVPDAIKHTAINTTELPPMESPDSLREFLWRKWVQHWFGNFTIYVRWEGEGEWKEGEKALIKFVLQEFDESIPNALVYDHMSNTDQDGSEGHGLYQNSAFHECIDIDSPLRSVFTDIFTSLQNLRDNQKVTIYRLIEASAVSVAILDERIYLEKERTNFGGMGTKKYSSKMTLKRAWEKRKVYLLDADKALSDFDAFMQESFHDKEDRYYDFLIVHQGRLEEIGKKFGAEKFEKGWETMKRKARWVIINTGRGKPPLAEKEGLRYVEYSNLSEILLKGAKIDLAYLLFALQAEPKKGGEHQ